MQNQFKQIILIYGALMLGQVLFCLVVIFIVTSGPDPAPQEGTPFELIVPTVIFVAIAGSFFVYRMRKQQGTALTGLSNKVEHYRTTAIMRSAILEGANLLAIFITFVTNNLNFLLWFSLGLLVFLYFRPSVEQFIRDYALSGQEEQELRKALG